LQQGPCSARGVSIFLGRKLILTYWVQLQGQGFGYRQDLGEVWQLCVTELLDNILANEFIGVLVKHILEVFVGL